MTSVPNEEVRAWLRAFLSTPRDNRDVKREAAARGISEWQLRTARQTLAVVMVRVGNRKAHGSQWALPARSDVAPVRAPQSAVVRRHDPYQGLGPDALAFLRKREKFRRPLPGWAAR